MATDPEKPSNSDEPETDLSFFATPDYEQIGPYRILQTLGEGGMGIVYLAEQEEPLRRRVALKLVKLGMDTKEVLARFESERQALAILNHPNVAKVYDAGVTAEGRPYFVMEYVQGISITDYCDANRLDTQQRIQLFVRVCEGVQHAHQKGIIHRDLKPSNILITFQDENPLPKIIDFGVAKATAKRLTERTVFTELGQLIGTPEYMSPEQATMTGLDIDTRSDVYSLGVILYELLVGALPFDYKTLRKAGLDEICKTIRDEEPAKPSTRISTLGDASEGAMRRRRTDLAVLRRRLQGDLDWIVMKTLEKDRMRRYASASDLATDLDRHLKHEPVMAGPPSTTYRLRKFVRRHRAVVLAVALVVIAMLAGITGTTIGLIRARRAEQSAREDAETARQVSEFVVGLFEVSDPGEGRGSTITAREILEEGAEKITRELEDQPIVQARLMATIGRVYDRLGLYEQARPLLEAALKTRRDLLGEEHPDVASSLNSLGELHYSIGNYEEARPLLEQSLEIWERALGPDHPEVAESLNDLGDLLADTGDSEEARSFHERALEIREKAFGPDHPLVARSLNNLGTLYGKMGDEEGARPFFERALAIWERALGPDNPKVATALGNLATVLEVTGDPEGARPLYERALSIREKALGPDHPDVAISLVNLADFLDETDGEAARLYERALKIFEKAVGPDHSYVAHVLNSLGVLHLSAYDYEEARPFLDRALAIWEKAFGPDHPDVAFALYNLGIVNRNTGDYEEAQSLHERALAIWEKAFGPDHPEVAAGLWGLGRVYVAQADRTKAEPLFLRSLAIKKERLGEDHPEFAYDQACFFALFGDGDKAIEHLRRAADLGYDDGSEMAEATALVSLHGDPDFEAILAEVKKRAGK